VSSKPLDPEYSVEVDHLDERQWCEVLKGFDDANIWQTWSYGTVASGQRNLAHVVLKKGGSIVAVAQARIVKLPFLNVGIAYIRWGPLWRRAGAREDVNVFRQILRALRNELACKRGMVLRLLPAIFDDDQFGLAAILAEEGFAHAGPDTRSRTILVDLRPSLENLREGVKAHWKRELKIAERKDLEILEGTDDELFAAVIDIHQEMVSRKKFAEGADINQYRLIQARLPDEFKMKIMACRSNGSLCAGLICTRIGSTAVYLFGATSNVGMKSNGSYLLHWKLIERLKSEGCSTYDLNGINPARNPGTYKFKSDLGGVHGRDVCFVGSFESHANMFSRLCVTLSEKLLKGIHTAKLQFRAPRNLRLRPRPAESQ
jgi:hypothetical protein